MSRKRMISGCLLGGALVAALLIAGGAYGLMRSRAPAGEGPDLSPVLVFVVSPSSGAEVQAGDCVPLAVRATAPQAIVHVEFFADGRSLGEVTESPESAFWSWRAWPAGIHTLSARAPAADGQVGQSQTVIVNVLVGAGMMHIPAGGGGQTNMLKVHVI